MSKKKKSDPSFKDESSNLDFLTSGVSGGGLERRPAKKLVPSSDRLPSVRPKRDLTLGGVPKKSFIPTIPTSRRVKKDSEDTVTDTTPTKRGRGERKDKRERGKRKGKEIIASASVFSMGPADRGLARGRGGGGGGGGGGGSQGGVEDDIRFAKKPDFLTSKTTIKSERVADEESDPVQEGGMEELFSSSKQPPTQLPLDYRLHTKARVVTQKQVKALKGEPMDSSEPSPDLEGMMDTGDFVKPPKTMVAPPTDTKPQQTKISDLFTPKDPSKGQFLFLQLPDCLPTKVTATSDRENSDASVNGSSVTSTAGSKKPEETNDNSAAATEERHCSLRDLPEGLVGKLRVHKSGRVRLCLGEVSFDVAMGTPCGFLQELVSVRQEKPEAKLTVLGQLSHRLVCTPDFESILEQSEHR